MVHIANKIKLYSLYSYEMVNSIFKEIRLIIMQITRVRKTKETHEQFQCNNAKRREDEAMLIEIKIEKMAFKLDCEENN